MYRFVMNNFKNPDDTMEEIIRMNRPPQDETFREAAEKFVDYYFEQEPPKKYNFFITPEQQKAICKTILCFVHETGIDSLHPLLEELKRKDVKYNSRSGNLGDAINFLYALYVNEDVFIDFHWKQYTKLHLREMVETIENGWESE